MASRDFQRNNGNNDMQCGCFNMMRAEDGKLLSHLEWPNNTFTCFVYAESVSHYELFGPQTPFCSIWHRPVGCSVDLLHLKLAILLVALLCPQLTVSKDSCFSYTEIIMSILPDLVSFVADKMKHCCCHMSAKQLF